MNKITIFIIICFVCFSCNKQKDEDQILKSPIYETEDFAIEFSLLDDNGNSVTKFKEGENIHFYFSLKNLSEEEIILKASHLFPNDFFMVYDEKNNEVGKPWLSYYCQFVFRPQIFKIQQGDTKIFCLPWIINDMDEWDEATSSPNSNPFCLCIGCTEPLKVGEYSSKFSIDLEYNIGGEHKAGTLAETIGGKEKRINDLFFKINFKVE